MSYVLNSHACVDPPHGPVFRCQISVPGISEPVLWCRAVGSTAAAGLCSCKIAEDG